MEIKICTKCKRELPLDAFRWKQKSEGRRHSQCKECQRTAEKKYYQNNNDRKNSVLFTAKNQKEQNTMLVDEYKQKGCQKCGEKRIYVLDCHHLDASTKLGNINDMIKSSGKEKLQKELNKCIVLCSNCHREFHFLERLNNITLEDYLLNY